MDEFDIDAQINKIKAQMDDTESSMFRNEQVLHSDEPSLADFEQVETPDLPQDENQLQDNIEADENSLKEVKEDEAEQQQERRFFEPAEEEWHDPFGRIDENNAVKKYVVYISQDFVPYIDDMDADARSAYINEALQFKQEYETKENRLFLYIKLLKHAFVCILTLIFAIPLLFWFANKSIDVTKENYSYVQKNFEKLYQERADRSQSVKVLPKKKRY